MTDISQLSEGEFDRLVEEVERLAAAPASQPHAAWAANADGFEQLVRDALADQPDYVQRELEGNLVVMVSDDGREHRAYGMYWGGTVVDDDYPHRIEIFRDTLTRDYGHDPDELRRQVTITVRHELAHHLGADEGWVQARGL
jgi:predicted Zn-dependent protease with MMP-like domain